MANGEWRVGEGAVACVLPYSPLAIRYSIRIYLTPAKRDRSRCALSSSGGRAPVQRSRASDRKSRWPDAPARGLRYRVHATRRSGVRKPEHSAPLRRKRILRSPAFPCEPPARFWLWPIDTGKILRMGSRRGAQLNNCVRRLVTSCIRSGLTKCSWFVLICAFPVTEGSHGQQAE